MSSQKMVAPRQVAAFQSLRPVVVDAAATCGAQVGVNLRWPDGSLVTEADLRGGGTTVIKSSGPETTDDLPEGQYNWYGNVSTRDVAATAYTAALGDNDTILRGTADAGLSITVPAGVFPPDVTLYACQGAVGPVTFVPGAGVTFLPADSAQTRDQGSLIGLKQTKQDVWEAVGDLAYTFPAMSVHANPTSADAQPVTMQATADKQVLKRIGGALQWVQQVAADVTFTPSGNLAATDVKAALVELDSKKVSYVALADAASATPGAMLVGFKPSGGIASAKVGDALRELDAKKATVGGAETFAAAGGTADALTAAFTPAITALVDGQQIKVRASAANTSTTPTLKVDALTARTITKNGNQPLAANDIYGAGHELLLRYVAAGPRWELMNPASSTGSTGGGASATVVADTPPANPTPGQGWIDSTSGTEYTYYDDGDSKQWVEMGSSRDSYGLQPYREGSAFPAGPALNDKFYRTDLNMLCYFDGTRWLTVNEYAIGPSDAGAYQQTSSSTTRLCRWPVRSDFGIYLKRLNVVTDVTGTNNASNYWSVALKWSAAADSVETTIATFNTASDSPATFNNHDQIIDAPLDGTARILFLLPSKTGAPGLLFSATSLVYRLIVT